MAFRLKKSEPVGKGLKRVARRTLQNAIDQLVSDEAGAAAIHESRKSLKKLRAIVKLVGDEVKLGGAERDLRSVGGALSPVRDAAAVIESAQGLCRGRRSLSSQTCAALGDVLRDERTRVDALARNTRLPQRAIKKLKRVQREMEHGTWNRVGFKQFTAGVRRQYRNARRAMRAARHDDRSETFHTWRKRVKTLWYALRLVEERVPVQRLVADLKRVESWLGDDHNLLVLRTQVGTKRAVREPGRVDRLAVRKQQELRRQAMTVGTRVFQPSPKAFIAELRQQWHVRTVV